MRVDPNVCLRRVRAEKAAQKEVALNIVSHGLWEATTQAVIVSLAYRYISRHNQFVRILMPIGFQNLELRWCKVEFTKRKGI